MAIEVSVIVPVYNTQDYLHRCIRSVLSQDGLKLELILIDDGSSDNSGAICAHYAGSDDRVVSLTRPNGGQGLARNDGIDVANGEYLYFVDSDDWLENRCLKFLLDASRKYELDICSPGVPAKYFHADLEYIACFPARSQFVARHLVDDHSIRQPSISSGQDGVFSNMILSVARKVGMERRAKYSYSHNRPGSTFAGHLHAHDKVVGTVDAHMRALEEFYTENGLWQSNGFRFLRFVEEETLQNRILPHLPFLSVLELQACILSVQQATAQALPFLGEEELRKLGSLTKAVVLGSPASATRALLSVKGDNPLGKPKLSPKGVSRYGTVVVSEFGDKRRRIPSPLSAVAAQHTGIGPNDSHDKSLKQLEQQTRGLSRKVDYLISVVNNSTMQMLNATRSSAPEVRSGSLPLVVSMTTIASRLPLVHLAIESVLNQSLSPARFVLWISDQIDLEDKLSPVLRELMSRGLEIRQVPDVGPHTKLVYAWREFQDLTIVTFDDDIAYPPQTLQCLHDAHLRAPTAVVANWARELSFDRKGKVRGVRSGRLLTPPLLEEDVELGRADQEPSLLAFAYGTGGVLYPPDSLDPRMDDIDLARALCPKEDDIWFKAMSLLHGTRVLPTGLGISPSHYSIFGTQAVALRHDNHEKGEHAVQLERVFDYFDLYDLLGGSGRG